MRRLLPVCVSTTSSSLLPVGFATSAALAPLAAIMVSYRWSQVSNNKSEGYYRLDARNIRIPDDAYEILTSRGSGPGGQGAQSSSNKVELRLKVSALQSILDEDIFSAFLRRESKNNGGRLTCGDEYLVVSSHEHRSAQKNKEECIATVKDIIAKASWVPPVAADPIETPASTISKHKNERRKRSNALKARSAARRGLW